MKETVLGLDLGTNSIGWALLENNDDGPTGIIACGSRIFQEAVDLKTRVPKNQSRRDARAARRLISRRKRRKQAVLNLLVRAGLLPQDNAERNAILTDVKAYDPYILRKEALDRKLTDYEFGRAVYHLGQRRGFLSNRKAKSKDPKEDKSVKGDIAALQRAIAESKSRTLGEYLASSEKKRRLYTERAMFENEFEFVWEAQRKHHPVALDGALKASLHKTIFHQRPLRLQKHLIGKCTFEPTRKRAPRATLEAQQFRYLQDVNHLTIKNPMTREYRKLTEEERQKLYAVLEKQKTTGWSNTRKLLDLHEGELFNLEEGKKTDLKGNSTAYKLHKILGKKWDLMSAAEKDSLITDLLTIDNEKGLLNRMATHWKFDQETSEKLAMVDLEQGYMRLSRKAINRILPFLMEGKTYDEACSMAGYDHSKPLKVNETDLLGHPPQLRNPVVQKALHETRKVINAVIRAYVKPGVIRIEMARDMKMTKKQRDEYGKKQNQQKKDNEQAETILTNDFVIQNPTRADIQKYRMWLECDKTCPYTGTQITPTMLFSPEVDVEHILPYSKSLDDSYMNKTLCMAAENRAIKKNNSPFEAYHANAEKFGAILKRVEKLPWPKKKKFEQKTIDTDRFVERQLNDTRYICKEVKKYVEALGVAVEVTKGEATGALRHRWGLNRVLSDDGEKNRADHRHHAVDAIVVALTSRSLFQKLSRLSAQSSASLSERGFQLNDPWPSFFSDVCNKIKGVIVSHAADRKLTKALHEETVYGWLASKELFAYRKPLTSFSSEKQLEDIGDRIVRELVVKRLKEFTGDFKKAFADEANPVLHLDGLTPIKSARVHVVKKFPEKSMLAIKQNGVPYKYFDLGNNHHVEIVEDVKTGKRKGIFVTTIEAAKRARIDKEAIVQRDHGEDWKFIMSLCKNDMLEITDKNGVVEYYRVKEMTGPNNTIVLRLHSSNPENSKERIGLLQCTPNKMPKPCKKVAIDPLGNVSACND